MPFASPDPTATTDTSPFVLERYAVAEGGGRFVPAARLLVTPALKASGLLTLLGGETARTLLAVLSHVTPNGRIRPALAEVADALGVPAVAARERILRLAAVSFRGEPLARLTWHDNGLETVHPSGFLVSEREVAPSAAEEPEPDLRSSREAILAESRARYGTPRKEVERIVLAQLGHYPEETEEGPVGDAFRRLTTLGVSGDAARAMLDSHPLQDITDQLDWLPLRGDVRNPGRFVAAAIENRYEPPARVRLERALLVEEKAGESRPEHDEPDADASEAEAVDDLPSLDADLSPLREPLTPHENGV